VKLAFIGGKIASAGFKALGADVFDVPAPADARAAWRRVKPEDYAIIFITEPEYAVLAEELEPLRRLTVPVVTVVPPVEGAGQAGRDEIRALVERAVGTDAMFRD
jgi:vacuolar-type H+-ATPase subunit F/Vma7